MGLHYRSVDRYFFIHNASLMFIHYESTNLGINLGVNLLVNIKCNEEGESLKV